MNDLRDLLRHCFGIDAANDFNTTRTMTKPDPVVALYRANEALMEAKLALAAQGNADAAGHCTEAACDVVKAIAAAVRQRAEQVTS